MEQILQKTLRDNEKVLWFGRPTKTKLLPGEQRWNKNRAASADAEAASACGKSSPVRNSATRRRRNKSLISSFPRACTSGMTVSPPIAWLAGS